jgi:hypothetical protein
MWFLLGIEFRRRPKQADRPRLLEWKVSHDHLLLHPANAVVILKKAMPNGPDNPTLLAEKSPFGVTARRE